MTDNVSILIVDSEKDQADTVAAAMEELSARVVTVYSGQAALEVIRQQPVDIVVTDLSPQGGITGLDILDEAKRANPKASVIFTVASTAIDACKDSIRRGAYDYLVKPIDIERLRRIVIDSIGNLPAAKSTSHQKVKAVRRDFEFAGVIGKNAAMRSVFDVLRRVAPTNLTVLIEGESGTGKELLAKAIHNNSPRKNKTFRPLNCAGLSESLLESELFGHIKGAFTGAMTDRKGLFEIADKGTLFLDEIGDMPLIMQAKLLRVLEDGIVTPVGSNKSVLVDVRIISATNHNLAQLVEEKKFRQDLYFRIKGVSVTLPPLRHRPEDIPELISYFLGEAVAETGSGVKGITESALRMLTAYHWPGNIRQLKNCIRTMVVMTDRNVLDISDIPADIYHPRQLSGSVSRLPSNVEPSPIKLNELEKQAIVGTLAMVGGNREKAAQLLGIGERTLYRKIKEYNL